MQRGVGYRHRVSRSSVHLGLVVGTWLERITQQPDIGLLDIGFDRLPIWRNADASLCSSVVSMSSRGVYANVFCHPLRRSVALESSKRVITEATVRGAVAACSGSGRSVTETRRVPNRALSVTGHGRGLDVIAQAAGEQQRQQERNQRGGEADAVGIGEGHHGGLLGDLAQHQRHCGGVRGRF